MWLAKRCHAPVAHRARTSLRSNHVHFRPKPVRCSQPDAVRRIDGAGAHPGRAPRNRPSRPDRPAGRRHRRESHPRHRPPAVKRMILPDGRRHQGDRRLAGLRHVFGLRAGLPHVQGVADPAHPQDGRSSHRLPPGLILRLQHPHLFLESHDLLHDVPRRHRPRPDTPQTPSASAERRDEGLLDRLPSCGSSPPEPLSRPPCPSHPLGRPAGPVGTLR